MMSTTAELSRFERGFAKLQEIDGDAGQRVIDALADVAPDLARYVIEFAFGDVYQRPGLDLRTRELITVASLTTQGAIPQLRVHINGALNVGCSPAEVMETIIQMAIYAGFPAALNGAFALKEVLAERMALHDNKADAQRDVAVPKGTVSG